MSDLISRNEVMRIIKYRKDEHRVEYAHEKRDSSWFRGCECSTFERMISEIPTVEAKPVVHGAWIEAEEKMYRSPYALNYRCSECYEPSHATNFCQNCGADMRGGKNE